MTALREIPYNYTSFSDQEIVSLLLSPTAWQRLESLRAQRRTGFSAKWLLEVLGDLWIVQRNPYIAQDLQKRSGRYRAFFQLQQERLQAIEKRADGHPDVLAVLAEAQAAVARCAKQLLAEKAKAKQVLHRLKAYTRADNIRFDPYAKVAHVTDATDWRIAYPFVVLYPDSEDEVKALVKACIALDLVIIPRGGGTGYTGSAVPTVPFTAVFNLEKLEGLSKVTRQEIALAPDLPPQAVPLIRAEAGVVTRRVAEVAEAAGLVFAVDPTSADASTIGGNVAMNAGGKKAVLWGTALDNLHSWRMVTPQGRWLTVERLEHNLGKIHSQPTVRFVLKYFAEDDKTIEKEQILTFSGQSLRKEGLGKDVTDKFLGGLPGIQKEGCDGIITSATFILHRMPKAIRTVCLEFYSRDLHETVPAIVEIKQYLESRGEVLLAGLEHLDDRYLKAVKYSPKAAQGRLPKMLLLADIASDDDNACAEAAAHIVRLANARQGEGFIAVSPEARKRFWADRARTAAIAAHTNAFKINEDVVIPLERLAEYSQGIERLNIIQSLKNKISIVQAIENYLKNDLIKTLDKDIAPLSGEDCDILQAKRDYALAHLNVIERQWQGYLQHLDEKAENFPELCPKEHCRPGDSVLALLLRADIRISYRQQVAKPLEKIFAGQEGQIVRDKLLTIHQKLRSSRLFIALHMHAGDGNVHTNIPVNSHDPAMLAEAHRLVEEIMCLAKALDGVISGEHGIGLTKIPYMEAEALATFAEYKQQVDPEDRFNRGKLRAGMDLRHAYTPSLRLLEQEALILEQSELGALNDDIKNCLRCGKCKPVCMTHVPRANLPYSPRNKILATSLLIEAFLYEDQTRRGIALDHFEEMNDIADHCTVCHKCANPCPVDIDFGDVTMRMRKILKERGQRRSNPIATAAMLFLNIKDPATITVMRAVMMQFGYRAHAFSVQLLRRLGIIGLLEKKRPKETTGKSGLVTQTLHFIRKPMPTALPMRTTRGLLGIEDAKMVPIIRDAAKVTENSDAVFYFPGCGSERLFSQIALATIGMLYEVGAQTVLPPGYLCCGYPQRAAGDADKALAISTENRVLFHRVAQTLRYLNIKTVIVSCGTCMDQLLQYEFERIFPGCRLLDIHEYLMEKGVALGGVKGVQYLYHEPCHTPMKSYNSLKVSEKLLGEPVTLTERCCGEAGTFAISRPDIATQVRFSKQENLQATLEKVTGMPTVKNGEVKLLTSCPACQQGLSRYQPDTGLTTDYIVVELAKQRFGEDWAAAFAKKINAGGVEKILL